MNNYWPPPFNRLFSTPLVMGERVISLPDDVRSTHCAYFGGTGVGKTTHLVGLKLIDVIRRVLDLSSRGWIFFDPAGDASQELISRLALLALTYPRLKDLVIIIDPTIEDWTVGINPLLLSPGQVPERKAKLLADMVVTIFQDDPQLVVRMYRIVYYSFLTLMLARLTLVEMPRLLTDVVFRLELVNRLGHEEVSRFWLQEFPSKNGEAMVRVESTLNRIDRLQDPDLAAMLGGAKTVDIEEAMNRGCFIVVRAPKGIIGADNSYLLCALLIHECWQAALRRADIPRKSRRPFALVADEFVNYLTSDFEQMVSMARQYRLELILSTQNVATHLKTETMLASVLNSINNLFSFRLGYAEAGQLVREIMVPNLDQIKDLQRTFHMSGSIPTWDERRTWRSMEEIWEREIRLITQLPPQHLYWRQRTRQETRFMRSIRIVDVDDLTAARYVPQAREALLNNVRRTYGKPKNVEHRRASRIDVPPPFAGDPDERGYT